MDAESGNVAEITVSMNHPYNENVITAFPRNVVDKRTDLCYQQIQDGTPWWENKNMKRFQNVRKRSMLEAVK